MDKKEALEILRNHTQYFVSTYDLIALEIAMESLENEIEEESKCK